MDESYDHYIRTDEEMDNIHSYILENPVKAKLVERWQDWPYTYTNIRRNEETSCAAKYIRAAKVWQNLFGR